MSQAESKEREPPRPISELEPITGVERLDDAAERVLRRVLGDRLILENLPDVVAVMDREMTILYLNRTIPGHRVSEYVGQSALATMPAAQHPDFSEAFAHAWTTGQRGSLEFASLSSYYWQTRFIPVTEAGEVMLMLTTSIDSTERVIAERALRESESRLRHAVEVVGMGTWTHDWRSDGVQLDDALCAIFGVARGQAPKTLEAVMRVIHTEDAARVLASLTHACLTGAYEDLEHRIVQPSGEIRHVVSKGSAIRDAQGVSVGSLGAVFDVTARKRLEEQLYQGQKMEAVGQLTAGIAHNFNNVLSIILPNVAMCLRAAPPELEPRLADIQHAAERAADLVRQLLLFARRDTSVHKSPIDPMTVVSRTLDICRTTFDRRIEFELAVRGSVPRVLAHEGQLEQTLLNICLNARDALEDASTPTPRIAMEVERSERGWLLIRVRDNGPGMDEHVRARAFEPFFTTKCVGRGTGLGLASAYAIVHDHGGQLTCQTAAGQGATFQIELPPVHDMAATALPLRAAKQKMRRGTETVLIVDDEPLVRRATRAMLEHGGYRVLECGDGDEALDLYERSRANIDLIILDRSMPGLSGDQVFEALRAVRCRAPIVLMSGHVPESLSAEAASAVLTKPVGLATLLDTVRTALDRM